MPSKEIPPFLASSTSSEQHPLSPPFTQHNPIITAAFITTQQSPLSHPSETYVQILPPPTLPYPVLSNPASSPSSLQCLQSQKKRYVHHTNPVKSTHSFPNQPLAFPVKATAHPLQTKMDRLTARSDSKPLPPTPDDWPLSSLPHPSLVNVPKESKRHCRLLPAGMVNLTLAQMADAVGDEEMMKLKKRNSNNRRRQVEMFGGCESARGRRAADEYELKIRKKREEGMRMRRAKKIVVVVEEGEKITAVEQQPETMDSVDELSPSRHPASDKTTQPPQKISSSSPSSPAAAPPTRPPRAPTSSMFETAHKTTPTPTPTITITTTQPPLPNPPAPHKPSRPPQYPPTTPQPPITIHTALHSNPPTFTDLTHARALTAKHSHSHSPIPNHNTTTSNTPARVSRRSRNTLAALAPAVAAGQQQRTTLTRYVSKARRTKGVVGRGLGRVFFGW